MKRTVSFLLAAAALALLLPACGSDETVTNHYSVVNYVQIKTSFLPDASQGEAYSQTLAAIGGSGTCTWTLEAGGLNDAWLSVDPSTGELSGTPATVGPVRLVVRATDAEDTGNYDERMYDFSVAVFAPTLTFDTTDPLPAAGVNELYSQTLTVSGGSGSYVFSKQSGGTNDGWLSMDPSTGELSGTPTATGETAVVVKVVDAANSLDTAQKTFHIEIKNVAITTATLPGAYQDQAYSQDLSALGGSQPYAWSLRAGGENYAWLSINASTGELTGTPTSAELGPVTVIVRVDDDGGNFDIRLFSFTVRVYDPPVIASTHLADGLASQAYSAVVPVTGGAGALRYSITGGTNHEWLTLGSASGLLSGTPTIEEAGAVSVSVKVEEADNPAVYDEAVLTFDVLGVKITTVLLPNAATDAAYAFLVQAKGGSGYYVWSVDDGSSSNHGWLTLDPDNGSLSGTAPSTIQEVTLAVDVEDSLYPSLTHAATFRFHVFGSVYAEDFEAGMPGSWNADTPWNAGALSDTHVGPVSAPQGSNVAATQVQGYYANSIAWGSGDLTSAVVALPSTSNALYLVYQQWYHAQADDGGRLRIHDGSAWNDLTPANGYDGKVDAGGQNADGFTGRRGAWHRVVADLSAYQGTSVRLRWSFFSDGSEGAPGWYVDDVRILEVVATALPEKTVNPFPGDGWAYAPAEDSVYASAFGLRWTPSLSADSYEVYAGTDPAAVASADTAASEYLGSTAEPFYVDAAGTFAAGATYFWRVDAVNAQGTTTGEIWSFAASDPVAVLVNEVNAYNYYMGGYFRPRFVELFNASSVHQDLSAWRLGVYEGGSLQGTLSFPAGTVLGPGEGLVALGQSYSRMNWIASPCDRAYPATFDFGWSGGLAEGEVVLADTSGAGVDYMGFNVVTSHLPVDLMWMGSIPTPTYNYYGDFFRTSTSDTDSASDWSFQYGPNSATPGARNSGQ